MEALNSIGFGGSCHWCTEAVFQSLRGVSHVQQGWIASDGRTAYFSEAVVVTFNPRAVSLATLIAVHLYTHSCTADHTMRNKYRSAIYTSNQKQSLTARREIERLQSEFEKPIITGVLHLQKFKLNEEKYLNYYYSDPEKPFCKNVVNPKLKLLLKRFEAVVNKDFIV